LLDANLREYLALADLTGRGNFGQKVACLQLKMTAIVPTDLLAKLTDIIVESVSFNFISVFQTILKISHDYSRRRIK
jgi:hypothetical protein